MKNDTGQRIRLQKILSAVVSRRKADGYIADGRVKVNGVVATLGMKADPMADEVLLDGVRVQGADAPVYMMLNKPERVVTTAHDPQGRPTVFDLLPAGVRCFSVGRLDFDSGGLLLLTNDGDFAYRLTHPSCEVKKVYEARVRGVPSAAALAQLRTGVEIDGQMTAPCGVDVIKKERDALLRITLHEGRNRQVRKMCEAVGHRVQALTRVAIGALLLGVLPKGQWRYLTAHEVNQFG